MDIKALVKDWFEKWEIGNFLQLPIAEKFRHTSPFGVIKGRQQYIDIIKENQDKFLGHRFEIHDEIYMDDRGCVRYTAIQGDFRLDVSEWYYVNENLIEEIISYYHIGEISEDRKLRNAVGE